MAAYHHVMVQRNNPAIRNLIEPLLLLLIAPFALFPTPVRFIALLAIPALWLWHWRTAYVPHSALRTPHSAFRNFIPRTPLDLPILLLAIMVLVSLYATYDIAVSLPKIAGVVFGVGVFYAVVRASERPSGWWLAFSAFAAMGVGVAAIGLLGTKWISKISSFAPVIALLPPRIVGLPGAAEGLHPNEVAGALLWVIPPLMVVAWLVVSHVRLIHARIGRFRGSLLLVAVIAANVLAIGTFVLTQSRSGYIAAAITAATLAMVAMPGRARWIVVGCLVALAGLGAVAAWQYGTEAVLQTITGSVNVDDPALSLDTLNGRLEIWSRALYGLQDFPFTGMGMNTFRHIVHVLYPLFLIGPDVDIAHAHNEFLQAGLDLGIPGLIAFISLYLGAFWMLIDVLRTDAQYANFPCRMIALGLGGGLLAHLIYGLTDAVALGAKPGVLFWMMLGLIAGLHRRLAAATGTP